MREISEYFSAFAVQEIIVSVWSCLPKTKPQRSVSCLWILIHVQVLSGKANYTSNSLVRICNLLIFQTDQKAVHNKAIWVAFACSPHLIKFDRRQKLCRRGLCVHVCLIDFRRSWPFPIINHNLNDTCRKILLFFILHKALLLYYHHHLWMFNHSRTPWSQILCSGHPNMQVALPSSTNEFRWNCNSSKGVIRNWEFNGI